MGRKCRKCVWQTLLRNVYVNGEKINGNNWDINVG